MILTIFFSSDLAREMTNWTSFFQSTKEPTVATHMTAIRIAKPSIHAIIIVSKLFAKKRERVSLGINYLP